MDAADHVALICIHRSPSGITRDHSDSKSSLISLVILNICECNFMLLLKLLAELHTHHKLNQA